MKRTNESLVDISEKGGKMGDKLTYNSLSAHHYLRMIAVHPGLITDKNRIDPDAVQLMEALKELYGLDAEKGDYPTLKVLSERSKEVLREIFSHILFMERNPDVRRKVMVF